MALRFGPRDATALSSLGFERRYGRFVPIDRSSLEAWYEGYEKDWLLPAGRQTNEALRKFLDDEFAGRARGRYRLGEPRVKSVNRLFLKANQATRRDLIGEVEDVIDHIDDLVGVRISCTNLGDVDELVGRIRSEFEEEGFRRDALPQCGIAVEHGSAKDYIESPKDSGYRACHFNLLVGVPAPRNPQCVRVELQIRTHLQDAWGDLTHEDTYKPGGEVPPHVRTASRHMADLLAVVDQQAQSIREDLDQQIEEAADGSVNPAAADAIEDEDEDLRASVEAYVQRRHAEMTRPLPLASLAWELRSEFGEVLTQDWLGLGQMSAMLEGMLATGAVVKDKPGTLIPRDFDPQAFEPTKARPAGRQSALPEVLQRLRAIEPRFPALDTEQFGEAFGVLTIEHNNLRRERPEREPDLSYLNELTRRTRDRARHVGLSVGRSTFDYIGKSLLYGSLLGDAMTADEARSHFADVTVERLASLQVSVDDDSLRELRMWIEGEPDTGV